MGSIIGIRREDKNVWERRAPLVPQDVRELIEKEGCSFIVQPAPNRAFPDTDYAAAGAAISDDLDPCGVVLGVKEMHPSIFRTGGAYVFFAHVIKGQSYNMDMLKALMTKRGHLIDYEKISDERGRRLLFFGRHAGLAGMIDTLWAAGKRLAKGGTPNPFESIDPAHRYDELEEAKEAVRAAGRRIASAGLPEDLVPFTCGFAGYGNVSRGAQEIFDELPVREVAPGALPGRGEGSDKVVYKVVFREEDMVEPIQDGRSFDLAEYYEHPERFRPRFARFLPKLDLLINAIYWDEKYPRLATRSDLKTLFSGETAPRLKVIGDISCDLEGAVEATVRATDPGNPAFVYDPFTGASPDGLDGPGVVILAVDNLPAELPIEASRDFSGILKGFVGPLARADFESDSPDLPDPVKRALIVHRGELTADFRYIESNLQG
ncbi:MAG: bifunctional lysine ketoglutarate reductase /saccharopine dehydrogenase family protein [Planctomycetota bacterium]